MFSSWSGLGSTRVFRPIPNRCFWIRFLISAFPVFGSYLVGVKIPAIKSPIEKPSKHMIDLTRVSSLLQSPLKMSITELFNHQIPIHVGVFFKENIYVKNVTMYDFV